MQPDDLAPTSQAPRLPATQVRSAQLQVAEHCSPTGSRPSVCVVLQAQLQQQKLEMAGLMGLVASSPLAPGVAPTLAVSALRKISFEYFCVVWYDVLHHVLQGLG